MGHTLRFEHLLNPNTFIGDECVGLVAGPPGIVLDTIPDENWCQVPERLFARLLNVAAAYSLHIANVFGETEDTEINSIQCEGLHCLAVVL